MTDPRRILARLAPLGVLAVVAAGWLTPIGGLRLSAGDEAAAARWAATLETLPADPVVLVGFDADVGTYPEIRPTVRTLLADLLARDARLAFVSVTPEGRALAVSELARMERLGVNPTRIVDLGFLPGAEAALVGLVRDLPPSDGGSALARRIDAEGIDAVALAVAIGGNDLGPRSWVEQVATRVDAVPLVAVAPTILLPELQPYVVTGQIDALVATPRDGAAYRLETDAGTLDRVAESTDRLGLPLLAGLVVALLVIGQALIGRTAATGRRDGA